jgi:hypothetical protein
MFPFFMESVHALAGRGSTLEAVQAVGAPLVDTSEGRAARPRSGGLSRPVGGERCSSRRLDSDPQGEGAGAARGAYSRRGT